MPRFQTALYPDTNLLSMNETRLQQAPAAQGRNPPRHTKHWKRKKLAWLHRSLPIYWERQSALFVAHWKFRRLFPHKINKAKNYLTCRYAKNLRWVFFSRFSSPVHRRGDPLHLLPNQGLRDRPVQVEAILVVLVRRGRGRGGGWPQGLHRPVPAPVVGQVGAAALAVLPQTREKNIFF